MNISISFEKLKLMLKMTYEEGKSDQLSICEPDVGMHFDPTFEDSKAGHWIRATNESYKRKRVGKVSRKNKDIKRSNAK